jgi:hypothetical protein
VRGAALWLLGASIAFLATAGAFLLLANFGSSSATSDPIPPANPSGAGSLKPTVEVPSPQAVPSEAGLPGSSLVLNIPEDRLEGLEKKSGQKLALNVENVGDEELSSVDLALGVASENTAQPQTRHYQEKVEELPPGEETSVEFEIDLSPPVQTESREAASSVDSQERREILEIKATTPEGDSAFKTAVLAS